MPVGDSHAQGRATLQKWGCGVGGGMGERVLPGRFMEASFYGSHVCPHEHWASVCLPGTARTLPAPLFPNVWTDSVWSRCTAMRCYIQASSSLGQRGGGYLEWEGGSWVEGTREKRLETEQMQERMREKSEKNTGRNSSGRIVLTGHLTHYTWMRWGHSGWRTGSQDSPRRSFYFSIQSSLVVSQEQLEKHQQSFNSLLPEGLSSGFGPALIIHFYEAVMWPTGPRNQLKLLDFLWKSNVITEENFSFSKQPSFKRLCVDALFSQTQS